MPKKFLIFSCLAILFLIVSCEKPVEYSEPAPIEKLVIESYLVEGDTLAFVRVAKTISAYDKGNHASITDTALAALNAEVKLSFGNQTSLLREAKTGDPHYFGSRPGFYPTYYGNLSVPSGSKCTLEVKYKNHHIVTDAECPSKPIINRALFKAEVKEGYLYYNTSLNLTFTENGSRYYRISITAQDINSPKLRANTNYQYFILNGSAVNKDFNISVKGLRSSGDLSGIKRVLVTVEHVSEEYYNFLYAIPEFRRSILNDYNTEVVEIPSNVRGGLGIFTITSKDTAWADISN